MESVRLAEEHFQHSHHGGVAINRQDQHGLGLELPANGRFNPRVGLGILDSQNLASRLVVRRNTQYGRHVPPDIRGSTSASGPVHQLIPLQQSDGDSVGVGDVLRTVGDQAHGPIHVRCAGRNRPLEFEQGRKRLSVHPTLLHGKCVGQKVLEGFAIDAGMVTHTRESRKYAAGAGWAADGRALRTSPPGLVLQFLIRPMFCQRRAFTKSKRVALRIRR